MAEEVKNKKGCGLGTAFTVSVVSFVLFLAIMGGAAFVVEVPLYLAFGWVFFLKDNAMRMNFGWEMIASSLTGVILCLWLTHAFCRWVVKQKETAPWRFSQTLRLNALVFLFFAASCALVGIVHQSIWLLSNPVVVDRSRNMDRTRDYSQMKQIYLLLLDYENENGVFPDSLQVLQDDGYVKSNELFYARMRKMREPYLYLGKGQSTSSSADRVILISPFMYGNRVLYLRFDGSVRDNRIFDDMAGEEQFKEVLRDGHWPKYQTN